MSVYVGIDVHRKRSQVAVINEAGEVLANRNVANGVKPVLSVIGGLPAATPAARPSPSAASTRPSTRGPAAAGPGSSSANGSSTSKSAGSR